jgi:hypothetical protein
VLRGLPTSSRWVTAVALVMGIAAVASLASEPASASRVGGGCGMASASTVGVVDATVTADIYQNELAGSEVTADLAHIAGAGDLISAVASDSRAETLKAVSRIVFHPHWHIVRLRAIDAKGRILADVGGPYVVAPVPGVLRSGARVVGSFVMSVQDDSGLTKLESRFVGDPIGLYVRGMLVAGLGAGLPSRLPVSVTVTLRGVPFRLMSEALLAFSSGTATAVVFVPPPSRSLSVEPCETVRAQEFGRVAARLARLASALPEHYNDYAATVRLYTGAEVFVRRGSDQLASTDGPGPSLLPAGGNVTYQGASWLVSSFATRPNTRVYLLVVPS